MEEEANNQVPQEENASEEKPNKDVSFPRRKEKKGSKKKLIILVIVILIIIAGVAYYILSEPSIDKEVVVSPTPINEVTPRPTLMVEEIKRDDIVVSVLNGTGISGAAGDLKDEIESLGYSEVEVGNAKSKEHEVTSVTFVSGVSSAVKDEITDLLDGLYKDVEVTSSTLSGADVEITTGFPKGHTATPTDAPKSTATPTTDVTGSVTPTSTPTSTPTPTP